MMQKKWNIKVDLCEVRERLLNTGHGERLHCPWSGCERERLPAGLFVFCCCFFCKGGRFSAEGLNDTTLWSCCERERLPAGLFVETSDKKLVYVLPRSQLVAVTDQHHTVTVCLSTTPDNFCEFPQFFAGFSRQSQNGKGWYPADRFGFDKKILLTKKDFSFVFLPFFLSFFPFLFPFFFPFLFSFLFSLLRNWSDTEGSRPGKSWTGGRFF